MTEDGVSRQSLRSWQRWVFVLLISSFICISFTLKSSKFLLSQSTKLFERSTLELSGDFYKSFSLQNPQVDSACLSRTGHIFYAKSWQILPEAQVWEEAWKTYTDLHYRCTSNIANWTMHFLREDSQDQDCKFLIYTEAAVGLGNRIMSLISAFIYAKATDRVLLVDSRKHLANLICEPFPRSSWLLPLDFPFDQMFNSSSPSMAGLMEPDFNSSFIWLRLWHVMYGNDQKFFCREGQMKLATVKWVGWESNQFYVTSMLAMPMIWQKLNNLLQDGVPIFTYLARRLILPRNEVWGIILRVYLNYLTPSESRVRAQIRLHSRGNEAAFDDMAYKRMIDCFTTNKILPATELAENMTLLEHFSNANREDGSRISVLVASLQGRYYESLKSLYINHPAGGGKLVKIHTASSQGFQRDSDLDQNRAALAEMWLLSLSDHIAVSAYSTFGYVAHGLAGAKPYVLNIRGDLEKDESSACYRGQSAEPCTHFPKNPDCRGFNMSSEHEAWIQLHVKPCLDQTGGQQLVW